MLKKAIKAEPGFFISAQEGSRLMGMIIILSDGHKGRLKRREVLPEYRGRGITRGLVARAEKVFMIRGWRLSAAGLCGTTKPRQC